MIEKSHFQGHGSAAEVELLPRLLRVEEAAFVAGVSRAQLYAYITDGQLPSIKIGRSRRIPLADLTAWLESRVTKQAPSRTSGS